VQLSSLQVVLKAGHEATKRRDPRVLPARIVGRDGGKSLFNVIDATDAGIDRAGNSQDTCLDETEEGIFGVPRCRDRVEPSLQHPQLSTVQLFALETVEDLNHEIEVIPINCVAEGIFRQVIRQKPPRRPPLEFTDLLRVMAVKLSAQEIGEHSVIAKPLSSFVKWHQEQILSLQKLQHFLAASGPRDFVAQRTAEAI
jgi:hypothetical protein